MLKLQNVSFSYQNMPVLRQLYLNLASGDRIAIMGPSGRGKTTLLHLMAGLYTPQEGTVEGVPSQGVAMVFQENRLLPWLTLEQNVLLPVPEKKLEARRLLERLGLSGWEDRYPGELSGGMARRGAIARALLFDSPLVLMDEPFQGLDEKTRAAAAEVVLDYTRNRALAAVVHDPSEVKLLEAMVFDLTSQDDLRSVPKAGIPFDEK